MTDTSAAPTSNASEPSSPATPDAPATPAPEAPKPTAEAPKPTPPAGDRRFTQAELEEQIGARLTRERAKFADYDTLKAAAEAAESAKAEHEATLAAERERADKADLAYKRLVVAMRYGLTDAEEVELMLTGTDEDTLDKQAARLAGKPQVETPPAATPPVGGFYLDESGRRDTSSDGGRDAQARSFFGI